MRATQSVFDFGKAWVRSLRPSAPDSCRAKRTLVPQRDPALEKRCAALLASAGAAGLAVKVVWNPRLRTTAGMASSAKKAITLNPRLLKISQEEVQRTLLHELAHILASHRAGHRRIRDHGPEWRTACADLGIPGEARCHSLPFPRRRLARRHFYACRTCGTTLARVHPVRRRLACIKCCRAHNGGKYHERFRFVPVAPPEQARAA